MAIAASFGLGVAPAVGSAPPRRHQSDCELATERLVLIGGEFAITVWDSAADRDSFLTKRLRPAYDALGLSMDGLERKQFEVGTLVAGDLVGAAT